MGMFAGKIACLNPWFPSMSAKQYYARDPAPWVIDKARASDAQKAVWKAFTDAAKASIRAFPADGSFATLQKRVRSIGTELRGKVYAPAKRRIAVPT